MIVVQEVRSVLINTEGVDLPLHMLQDLYGLYLVLLARILLLGVKGIFICQYHTNPMLG